jgi:tripartite-type tricarboxylate transporter receptor subunit TctC
MNFRKTTIGATVLQALLLASALGIGPASSAMAQAFPSKPIKILVGFAPGGAMDIVARTVGQKVSASVGQPVIVDNKPGAGSNIAIRALIESAPDGYTVMLVANGLAANPALYQPVPFDPERDVVPVALVARLPVVIAANAKSEIASLAKLVEAAKARPGTVLYASPGNGSTPHLAVELFARAAGIALQHVPYKGGAPAINDVLGGQLPLVAVNAVEVLPHVKAGRLRVLAALSAERVSTLPDTPTIAESGYRGFEASVWHAFVAPRGTPPAVVERLSAEVRKSLASPEVKERLAGLGAEVSAAGPDELGTLIRMERARYGKLIREAGIKAN